MKTRGKALRLSLFILVFLAVCNKSIAQLKAKFTSNVQSGCAPLIVNFKDESTGNPASWSWRLGNGTISTYQNPITTYFDPGTYTVRLTVKNSAGLDSLVKTDYITVYANPTVVFNASPTQGCFPLNVKFTTSSKAGSGTTSNYLWDFGDGNIDSLQTPAHIYNSAGVFDITLKVTNSYGCYSALTKSDLIQIDDGVIAGFDLSSLDVCKSPATAIFNNSTKGSGNLSYEWNFGDGTTSNAATQTVSHNYNSSGYYDMVLTVQTASGCSDTASLRINVHFPISSFSHSDAACLNQAIHFTNTSMPAPVSCTWYFGDGTTSTDLNPDKIFNKTGSYTVKLVNVFSAGCSDSVSNTITIDAAPTASFTAYDTSKCTAPLTVNFANNTTGATSAYLWDFGDGDTSSAVNPTHIYTSQGNFTVKLTAFNLNGCPAVYEKKQYINIRPVKITGFKNLPDSGCVPLIVKPSVLINMNTNIKSISWDFGDGSTSTSEFPTHTYTKEGFFNVTVSIVTEDGCTDTYILANAVLAGHKPNADFIWAKDSVCANSTLVFTNTSTNGPITFLSWDGGALLDSASGQYYYRGFLDTGYHKGSLVAYNYGCPDTLYKDSVVYVLPPIAQIEYTMHCDDKKRVDFVDSSIVDITRTWDFGDGFTSAAANPTHVYTTPGSYTINLYTVNKTCRDTATASIQIINEAGLISLADSVFCRGNNIAADISGINLDNIKHTTWNFGDGTIVTVNGATKANHAYVVNGKFKIKATMVDKNNCQYNYESDSITIYGPLAVFTTLTPGACKGSTISFTDKSSSDGVHNIIKWSWNYGDNIEHVYSTPSVFSHVYVDTGYYSVRLTVTDSYGCSDSVKRGDYIFITHPTASFIISDSIACPAKQVSFQNTSSGISLDYLWNFGDGSQSNQKNPSYTYKFSGVYNPALFVTDINNCKDSLNSIQLTISKPIAKFSLSDSTSTCPPLQVNFINQSTNFTDVAWDFGDGSPSVNVSPTHIYTYPGVYPVKLITYGYGNCSDTAAIKNVIIKGPTGNINYNASPACYPYKTQFSATAKNVVLYTWDFSDGNTIQTTKNTTSYLYGPGRYVPKLILQDSAGCKVSIKGEDTITIYDVTANASTTGSPACNFSPVQFTDLSVSEDIITHHYWYFGDDSSADQKTVTHFYKDTGIYNAYLIAETKTGCRDTFSIPSGIQILPTPQINIIADSAVCAAATVSFKGKSAATDSSLTWNWDFGNGKTSNGQSTSTAYTNSGNYAVKLIAVSAGGCSDATTKPIKVNALPKVTANADTTICRQGTFQLNAGGAQTYTWSGTGLSCLNCSAPVVNPDSSSRYIVNGKDAFGCTASDSVTIDVIQPAKLIVAAGDTLCVGESRLLQASGASSYQWYPSLYLDDDKSAQPVFTPLKDTSFTYKVIGYTAQNCFADTGYVSVKAYPIPKLDIAQDEIVLNIGSSVQLHTGGSPDIVTWNWQPPQGLSNSNIADPIASPLKTTTYSCVASNGGSCVSRDEITIRVICSNANVYIPNTFSPNNDGMNDKFFPRGSGLFNIKSFRVFNRWGQLVFERFNAAPNNENEGWDGNFNGKSLASDVYVYIIEVVCQNNLVIPFKGNITLIK